MVTLFHSNTERGYLSSVLQGKLTKILEGEWKRIREEEEKKREEKGIMTPEWEDAVKDESVLVEVSEKDRDPYGIVVLQSSRQVGKPLSPTKEEQ